MKKVILVFGLLVTSLVAYYFHTQRSPEIIPRETREELEQISNGSNKPVKAKKSEKVNRPAGPEKDLNSKKEAQEIKEVLLDEKEKSKLIETIKQTNKVYANHEITIKGLDKKRNHTHVVFKSKDKQRPTSFSARVDSNGKIIKTWGQSQFEDYQGAPVRFGLPEQQ